MASTRSQSRSPIGGSAKQVNPSGGLVAMSELSTSVTVPDSRLYRGFEDLARAQSRGRDYEILVRRRAGSSVAIIAPHGGGIEDGTSAVASAIASDDFSLYLFEGIRRSGNYAALHLTSTL